MAELGTSVTLLARSIYHSPLQNIPIQHPRMDPTTGPILGQLAPPCSDNKLPTLLTDFKSALLPANTSFSDEQVKLLDQQCHLSFVLPPAQPYCIVIEVTYTVYIGLACLCSPSACLNRQTPQRQNTNLPTPNLSVSFDAPQHDNCKPKQPESTQINKPTSLLPRYQHIAEPARNSTNSDSHRLAARMINAKPPGVASQSFTPETPNAKNQMPSDGYLRT